MIGALHFVVDGVVHPCYVLDMAGNLVRCSQDGSPQSLLPFATEMVSSSDEVSSPRPWSITPQAVISRVNEVAQLQPKVLEAYPGGVVQKMSLPFAAPVDTRETEESILQAVEILPGLDEETARTVRETLAIHAFILCLFLAHSTKRFIRRKPVSSVLVRSGKLRMVGSQT